MTNEKRGVTGPPIVYFSKEVVEILKQNAQMSPSTWHKIMNPYCGQCMYERGLKVLQDGWDDRK